MDLEAEYNNRAKVPDCLAIMEGWRRDAAAFRAGHSSAEIGLAYGPGERQVLDLFWPAGDREAALALFLHGGYWQALDKSWFSHLAAGLNRCGVAVAIPSYPLCPDVTLAALVDSVRDAAAYLFRRHGRRMLATGHSAGGHLTAMLMATDWSARGLPPGIVPNGLPISGLFDLEPLVHTSINGALSLDEAEARRLSPLALEAPGGALRAVVGGEEGKEYERQSRSIAERWDGSWTSVPGANHFTVVAPLAEPGSALTRAALDLLPPPR